MTDQEVVLEGPVLTVDGQVAGTDLVERSGSTILPAWTRSRSQIAETVGGGLLRLLRRTAFHAVRLPLYWLRLSSGFHRGIGVLGRRNRAWRTNSADIELLKDLMASGMGDKSTSERMNRYDDTARRRRKTVRFLTVLILAVAVPVIAFLPWKALAVAALIGLPILGLIGRRPEQQITSRAINMQEMPRFTTDLILNALGSLGIGELNKALNQASRDFGREAIGWPSPIVREGKGWRAELDLPAGVTATKIIDKRDELASGLRRPLASVWPEADDGVHAGRLVLYVSDQPLSQTKQGAWPLALKGSTNLFDPQPIGTDPRGQVITQVLMFCSKIIGALPRMGKTFSLRLDLLIAALDVHAEIHAYDLKGGADFMPLEPICYRFRVGSDDDDIEYLARDVRAMREDMTRRYKMLRSLPRDICPEGKVTPELAAQRRYGLFPVVIGVDECQIAFEDETFGAAIEKAVTDLVKRGPAVGLIVILATQRPDAKSLPTGISANAMLRFCLKVMGQVENDMVLGTSSYKNGIRATQFGRKERGVGWLAGEGDDPTIVRNYYIDGPATEKIVDRARRARIAAGTLLGHAAGQDVEGEEPDTDTILEHLAAVWPLDEKTGMPRTRVWWGELADLLAESNPYYAEVKPGAVREQSRLEGYQMKVWIDGREANRRGPSHEDLLRELAQKQTDQSLAGDDQEDD